MSLLIDLDLLIPSSRDMMGYFKQKITLSRCAKEKIPPSSSSSSTFPSSSSTSNISEEYTEGKHWLLEMTENHLELTGSSLTPTNFITSLISLCRKSKNQVELETSLFEFIGELNFEFLMQIVQHSEEIKEYRVKDIVTTKSKPKQLEQPQEKIPKNFEGLSANQKKKLALKEQKELEKALKESQEESMKAVSQLNLGQDLSVSGYDYLESIGFNPEFLAQERSLGLQKNQLIHLPPGSSQSSSSSGFISDMSFGQKGGLPLNSTRKTSQGIEEIFIPAGPRPLPPKESECVQVSTLMPYMFQDAFQGIKQLNRIQSKVYSCTFNSIENMLVCAPTGAGKTNIAVLAILQMIKMNLKPNEPDEELLDDFDNEDGEVFSVSNKNNKKKLDNIKKKYPDNITPKNIDKTNFKIIYIAPMKALAQEVVTKFQERLKPLNLIVKEYTGDMQLTKQEISEANILVCTPEKYDVATRKGGDGSLITMVNLIIIDEVHLLSDERGAVIETIVARTNRYVESSQKLVRIIGLSATLPNYKDVASFLKVNPSSGLFFFGPEYRPVPLDQTFVGVTEKNRNKRNELMNRQAYIKMITALENNKQVMIFVHSRKETSKTLEAILELCSKNNTHSLLENVHHDKFRLFKQAVDKSRSKELQTFFANGMGIHHAGMLRNDRTLTENMFEAGLIKVLCCTSTLAWGVNLPAHTVIIKGTELYDPERGGFVDVSMLDVLQIFGRAGRPQYDNTGHAILITPHATLAKYLGMLSNQAPIESSLIKCLADHLNAEIVNNTVNNIQEASLWLSYTFLFVRMKKSPFFYGIDPEVLFTDPQLTEKRTELIIQAAELLDSCMMIRYDKRSGNLSSTDLGRIASHYYIKHTSIDSFNHMLAPHITDEDAVKILCSSAEFDQLKVRPEEIAELEQIKKLSSNASLLKPVKKKLDEKNKESKDSKIITSTSSLSSEDTSGKVCILLNSFLCGTKISSFTLQSDLNYVSQNGSRICRALFEICLKRGWCILAQYYLILSKAIDRRMQPHQTPLRQFSGEIPNDVLNKIDENQISLSQLLDSSVREIGELIRHQKSAHIVKSMLQYLPLLSVNVDIKPLTPTIIRMVLNISLQFKWNDKYHGNAESFWIWIEDGENEYIYHAENLLITRKDKLEDKVIEVILPVKIPLPKQYFVRILSEYWVGCDSVTPISFHHLLLPLTRGRNSNRSKNIGGNIKGTLGEAIDLTGFNDDEGGIFSDGIHTDLLPLHPIPISALNNKVFESLYNKQFTHFNPVQTQMFHALYHTDNNVLVGAPTGSGKTITAELAILRIVQRNNLKRELYLKEKKNNKSIPEPKYEKIVYVAPLKALARERIKDWSGNFSKVLKLNIVELTGESTPETEELYRADIFIVTPEKWDSISRGWQYRSYVQEVGLVVIDEIHLLGVERGAVLEVLVSRMRFIAAQKYRDLLNKFKENGQVVNMKEHDSIRFVGLSTALSNARDLADWLGITDGSGLWLSENSKYALSNSNRISISNPLPNPKGGAGLFNFRPSVRPVPTTIYIRGFTGKHYCPRMATMNKPAFLAINEYSPHKPVLIFVSSRRQTRLTALDLIAECAASDKPRRFLGDCGLPNSDSGGIKGMTEEEVEEIILDIKDSALRDTIRFGIGIHHAGLNSQDRNLVENLFFNRKIQVLVCTSTLAWGVNLPCHLVIVKGTEYFDAKTATYVDYPVTDIMQMIGRAGRPQFDNTATACVFVQESKKPFYQKFLHEPFPVESSLFTQLEEHINAEIANNVLHSTSDCIEYLTWTYYYRRLVMNPSYYLLKEITPQGVYNHLLELVNKVLDNLNASKNIIMEDDTQNSHSASHKLLKPTPLGRIASYYYLKYSTPFKFHEIYKAFMTQKIEGNIVSIDLNTTRLLKALSDAAEFSELPVRHNEDILNNALAQDLDLLTSDTRIFFNDPLSPHVKTLLLIFAHLKGGKLPITDYINDTKTVLDQFSRVLNSMVDVAAESGYLSIVILLSRLSKMVAQEIEDDAIAEWRQLLPNSRKFSILKLSNFKKILKTWSSKKLINIRKQSRVVNENQLIAAVSELGGDENFFHLLYQIPLFNIKFKIRSSIRDSNETTEWFQFDESTELKLFKGSKFEVEVSLKLQSGNVNLSSNSLSSLSSYNNNKNKTSSLWVALSYGEKSVKKYMKNLELYGSLSKDFNEKIDGEIIGLKKIKLKKDEVFVRFEAYCPEDIRTSELKWPLHISVLSDSYFGTDQSFDFENIKILL